MEQTSTRAGNADQQAEQHSEGKVARAIEEQTAKLPSDIFLWAAGAAVLGSMAFQVIGTRRSVLDLFTRRRAPVATFVGLWAPTILLLGIYNKIVKVAGSDRTEPEGAGGGRGRGGRQGGGRAGADRPS